MHQQMMNHGLLAHNEWNSNVQWNSPVAFNVMNGENRNNMGTGVGAQSNTMNNTNNMSISSVNNIDSMDMDVSTNMNTNRRRLQSNTNDDMMQVSEPSISHLCMASTFLYVLQNICGILDISKIDSQQINNTIIC